MSVLKLVRPFMAILPEVPEPQGRGKSIPFKDRGMYTLIVLGIFLVCSQLPLFGIKAAEGADPFYWARMIMASNRGTVMELGISPIVTSGLVMQLLTGSKIIDINPNVKTDRQLQKGAEKLVGILITLGEAIAYVMSGMYGDLRELGYVKAFLIIAQLFIAGILVLCLDEMLSNGYGLASGISLFIATNICETIVWKAFSPYTIAAYGRGPQFEGAVINLFHQLFTRSDKIRGLKDAFYRQRLPNITNILATIVVFLLVIYLQGWKVTIPLVNPRQRSTIEYPYPIKLFYTSNMPIILHSALVSNLYFISQLLFKKFGGNILVRLLGSWREIEGSGGQLMPSGGLIYYISAPISLSAAAAEPLHTIFYISFVLAVCALFSHTWIEVSGSSSREVAKNLTDQGLARKGHRLDEKSLRRELDRYIPTAAAFGGMCIGALTVLTDFMGALEKGTSILLATNMIYSLFEAYEKEQRQGYAGPPAQ